MRLFRSRLSLVGIAVSTVAAASLVSTPSSVAGFGPPAISFRVVQPDGSPVLRPVVMVSVFGHTYPQARVLQGGALGQVVVPFPADDPVAASRLASGESVNLMIRVFDKPPGSADINAAYVTAAVGVDAFGILRELSAVTGQTITLQAGRTAFVAVDKAAVARDLELPGTSETTQPRCDVNPEGAPYEAGMAYYCYSKDFPEWVGHIPVPIAENHGAGNDMFSSIRYSSTVVTTTGVAIQAGSLGFVAADGTVAYAKETTENLTWRDRGPNDNRRAILDSAFLREQAGVCYLRDDVRYCQLETTYRPDSANGTTSVDSWRLNDHMDIAHDCWASVDEGYEPVTKSQTQHSFALRLGPSETWAAMFGQGTLYVNTTITQQTNSGKSHIRGWFVRDSPAPIYENHYVYVPYGKLDRDTRTMSDGACVRANLGRVQTAAENYDYLNPPPTGVEPQPPPPPPDPTANENEPYAPVCGNMPDRCD